MNLVHTLIIAKIFFDLSQLGLQSSLLVKEALRLGLIFNFLNTKATKILRTSMAPINPYVTARLLPTRRG